MTDVNNDSSSGKSNGEGNRQATGGSQEFVPPNDGSWIPRERVNEMVQAATANTGREVAELRGQLQQLTEQLQSARAPAQLSVAELNAKVQSGEMTEAEAHQIQLDQRLSSLKNDIVTEVRTASAEERRVGLVTEQIEAYKAKIPNVMQEGSAERVRVVNEYNFLVHSLNRPANKETELQAIRTVFGPVDAIGGKAPGTPEHHQDTSGSGGGDESQSDENTEGAPANLSSGEKRFYADQIRKGIYKDWDAVKKELEYANPILRKRHGARA